MLARDTTAPLRFVVNDTPNLWPPEIMQEAYQVWVGSGLPVKKFRLSKALPLLQAYRTKERLRSAPAKVRHPRRKLP